MSKARKSKCPVFNDYRAAAQHCRKLAKRHPIAVFFATHRDSLGTSELSRLAELKCRLVVVTNVAFSDPKYYTCDKSIVYNNSPYRTCKKAPIVAAFVQDTRLSGITTIGNAVRVEAHSSIYPMHGSIADKRNFLSLYTECMFYMLLFKPKYVVFSPLNLLFNASLRSFLRFAYVPSLSIISFILQRTRTNYQVYYHQRAIASCHAVKRERMRHYNYKFLYRHTWQDMSVGGIEYPLPLDDFDSLFVNANSTQYRHHRYNYLMDYSHVTVLRRLYLTLYCKNLYNYFNNFGSRHLLDIGKTNIAANTISHLWFTPEIDCRCYSKLAICNTHNIQPCLSSLHSSSIVILQQKTGAKLIVTEFERLAEGNIV